MEDKIMISKTKNCRFAKTVRKGFVHSATTAAVLALCLITLLFIGCETTKYRDVPVEDDFDYKDFHFSRHPQFSEPAYDEVGEEHDYEDDNEWEVEAIPWIQGSAYTEAALRARYKALVLLHQAGINPYSLNAAESQEAQILKFTATLKTDDWTPRDQVQIKRTTTVQVLVYVWAFYSFTNNKDYYVIEQEISIPNQNLWNPNTRSTYHNALWHRTVDYYMGKVLIDNYLYQSELHHTNWGGITIHYYPLVPDSRMALTDTHPQTVNNSTTYSSSMSFSLGGAIGTPKQINSGMSISVGKSYNVLDFGVTAQSMSSGFNAAWQWKTNRLAEKGFGVDGFKLPPALSTDFSVFGSSWVWVVDNPAKDEMFRLGFYLSGEHISSNYVSKVFDPNVAHRLFPWSFDAGHFLLTPPIRTQ